MHRHRKLTLAQQALNLRRNFPFGNTTLQRSRLRWKGVLSPSEVGRNYLVELEYSLRTSPEVWVRTPDIQKLAGDRKLPHVYDHKSKRLCLYVPWRNFWAPDKALALTMIPWACLWLYYFELWLATDVWIGAGEHPDIGTHGPKAPPRSGVIVL